MAADRAHSLSSEKRLEQLYPDDYPVMCEISPGVVACREEDDEKFNQFLYETQQKRLAERDEEAMASEALRRAEAAFPKP